MSGRRQPPLRGLDDLRTVAYLAGLLDGTGGRIRIQRTRPGSIPSLRSDSYSLFVAITTTDEALVKHLADTLGGSWVWNNRSSHSLKWRCYGENAERLVRAVAPFMVRRHEHVKIALTFRALHAEYEGIVTDQLQAARHLLWERMKSLDSNGRIPWPEGEIRITASTPKRAAAAEARRSLQEEQEKAIEQSYTDGATLAELAAVYSVSAPTIRGALRRRAVNVRPRGVRPKAPLMVSA